MVLSIRTLTNFSDINSFSFAPAWDVMETDTPTLYFQLVDLAKNLAYYGFNPVGLPYHPSPTAVLSVTIQSIDDAKKIVRNASLVSANDTSIWSLDILTTDVLRGNASIQFTLTDGALVLHGYSAAALRVTPLSPGC